MMMMLLREKDKSRGSDIAAPSRRGACKRRLDAGGQTEPDNEEGSAEETRHEPYLCRAGGAERASLTTLPVRMRAGTAPPPPKPPNS
ncbi:unnamed protein product [Lampetra fluviatilis]